MWYTAVLMMFATLFLFGAWTDRNGLIKRFAQAILGAALFVWALYRSVTGDHSVTYQNIEIDTASVTVIPISDWGFAQYAAIALSILILMIAVESYRHFVRRG